MTRYTGGQAAALFAFALLSLSGTIRGGEPTFVDVTGAAGVAAPHSGDFLATGQAWGDYDRDGCPDLYLTDGAGPNSLYRNLCDGTFDHSQHSADVAAPWEAVGAVFGDYDNDGWLDLFAVGRQGGALYRNLGGEGFAEVTAAAGLGDPRPGSSAAWGDFDGDGDLDLYVVNYAGEGDADSRDTLFRNDGDGDTVTFTDVTTALDDDRTRGSGFTARWLDYDNDGDLDLYAVNDKAWGNLLWRNDGAGCEFWCFTDVSVASGAHRPVDGMGIAAGDYDNDGDLDLYFTSSNELVLLQNLTSQGDPSFVEVSIAAGVSFPAVGWGAAFLDYDNDGWPDLYVAIASAVGGPPMNRLFRNLGDGTFDDLSDGGGLGFTTGLATADYDGDGRMDVVIGNYGEGYHLYRNVTESGNHWLRVTLEGRDRINRDAIGARVVLATSDGRTQLQDLKSGSSLGAGSEMALHFGLGQATPELLTVVWPGGLRESYTQVPVDQTLHLVYSGIFGDGFESGDLSAWGDAAP